MRSFIYILLVVLLASCGGAEMSENAYAKVYSEDQALKEKKSESQEFTTREMEEYIELKLKDLIELQELLHNPEVDDEMKLYAKDMILKILPEESLLQENFIIKGYKLKYPEPSKLRGFDRKDKASWDLILHLPNDTLISRIAPVNTDTGTKLSFEVQVY